MSADKLAFFETLSRLPSRERLSRFLDFRLAPVMAGIKPAETISLCGGGLGLYSFWETHGQSFLRDRGLEAEVLREKEGCACVLVYERAALTSALSAPEERLFLANYGYAIPNALSRGAIPSEDKPTLESYVGRLRERFASTCPHEIGLFLGIPRDDVIGFIENSGENCLFIGYWKVYSRPLIARETFRRYDTARAEVMRRAPCSYARAYEF